MFFPPAKPIAFTVVHISLIWIYHRIRSKNQITNRPTAHAAAPKVDISPKKDVVSTSCDDCEMANSAPKIDRHIILCDNRTWPSKIEKEEGTTALELSDIFKSKEEKTTLKIKLTACDEPGSSMEGIIDIIVYPENVRYSINKGDLSIFADCMLSEDPISETSRHGLIHRPVEWKKLILVCTHAARDKRCGRAGPQVIEGMRKELTARGVSEAEVAVRGSSHIGGHKYAGTLIVYPSAQWYGQVTARTVSPLLDAIQLDEVLEKHSRGCSKKVAADW